MICSYFKSLKFFRTSKNGLNSDHFAKNAHKIAKSKHFPDILNDIGLSDKFPFRRHIICCSNLSLSKIIGGGGGGGHPAPPHPFILQNCVQVKTAFISASKATKQHSLSVSLNTTKAWY